MRGYLFSNMIVLTIKYFLYVVFIDHAKKNKNQHIKVHRHPKKIFSEENLSWGPLNPSPLLNSTSPHSPYLQPKKHSPRSLPFCFSSVSGTLSINAVSVSGSWATLTHKLCAWGTRHRIKTAWWNTTSFCDRCHHTDVKKCIPQLFRSVSTGLHFDSLVFSS